MALSIGNSIFILCDTLSKYQPVSYFKYKMYDNSYVTIPNNIPNNYIHWLHLFNDVYGDFVDVLYPINPNLGEHIIVLYHGFYQNENEWQEISWIHGKEKLFEKEIMPLLEREWTYKTQKI